jgi:hypothetical protein
MLKSLPLHRGSVGAWVWSETEGIGIEAVRARMCRNGFVSWICIGCGSLRGRRVGYLNQSGRRRLTPLRFPSPTSNLPFGGMGIRDQAGLKIVTLVAD